LNVLVDTLEDGEEILNLESLNIIVSLDGQSGNFVNILNANLEFRNVFNGGESESINATVSNSNNDVVV